MPITFGCNDCTTAGPCVKHGGRSTAVFSSDGKIYVDTNPEIGQMSPKDQLEHFKQFGQMDDATAVRLAAEGSAIAAEIFKMTRPMRDPEPLFPQQAIVDAERAGAEKERVACARILDFAIKKAQDRLDFGKTKEEGYDVTRELRAIVSALSQARNLIKNRGE